MDEWMDEWIQSYSCTGTDTSAAVQAVSSEFLMSKAPPDSLNSSCFLAAAPASPGFSCHGSHFVIPVAAVFLTVWVADECVVKMGAFVQLY